MAFIRINAPSENPMALSQTIVSLSGSIRTEKGCKRCDFCQSIEDENKLWLLEEWDTQENLKSYLKSGRFRVLLGAMNLLTQNFAKEEEDERINDCFNGFVCF